MVQISKTGIQLVNQEMRDLEEVYTWDATMNNGNGGYKPKSGNIGGGPLASNDADMVSLIQDYSKGGPGVTFYGGSTIDANGKLVVNTNIGMKWTEQNIAQGSTARTADLSFSNYQDAKLKGYDIIGRTDPEAFKTKLDGYADIYFGDDYKNNYTEDVVTKLQMSKGQYTEEVIKSYDEAEIAAEATYRANIAKVPLDFDQSDWQLVGGDPKRVIDPNNANDRQEYEDLLWKKLEAERGIATTSEIDVHKLKKSEAFAVKINNLRGVGIGGFDASWGTDVFKDFDARGLDPSTGQPWAANVPAANRIGLTQRKNITPKVLKVISKDVENKIAAGPAGVTDLAKLLSSMSPQKDKYKSGAQARQDIINVYQDDYKAKHGGSAGTPAEILKFAAGKDSVQPDSNLGLYYNADQIVPGGLFNLSGNSARKVNIDNAAQIYRRLLEETKKSGLISGADMNYIINETPVKSKNLPTVGTVRTRSTK